MLSPIERFRRRFGLHQPPIGPATEGIPCSHCCPWRSRHYGAGQNVWYGGRLIRQHERTFLARTARPARPLGDVAEMHAADGIAAWRWWTLAELDATDEAVWPSHLADLVRSAVQH